MSCVQPDEDGNRECTSSTFAHGVTTQRALVVRRMKIDQQRTTYPISSSCVYMRVCHVIDGFHIMDGVSHCIEFHSVVHVCDFRRLLIKHINVLQPHKRSEEKIESTEFLSLSLSG